MLGNEYWNWNKQALESYGWLWLLVLGHMHFFLGVTHIYKEKLANGGRNTFIAHTLFV